MEQTVFVEAKSQFGILDSESKQWLNPVKKDMVKNFQIGKGYVVNIVENVGKNGKVYKNIESFKELHDAPKKAEIAVKPAIAKAVPAKAEKPLAEVKGTTDWAAKDRSQLVGGRSHDAALLVQVCIQSCTDMDEVLRLYKKALEGVLEIAEEVK